MRQGGLLAAMALVASLAAGCGPFLGAEPVPAASCENLPSGACTEQTQAVAAGLGGRISSVILQCKLAQCTRASGAGVAEIRFADGHKVSRAWSYVGDPNPPPAPVCVGIPQQKCLAAETDLINDVPPSKFVVGATVTCRVANCTAERGEVTIVFALADGSTMTMGMGYAN